MNPRNIIGLLTILLIGGFVIAVVNPPEQKAREQVLPWQIAKRADGTTRVFGLTPGGSTLAEAVNRIKAQPKVNLFVSSEGPKNVEAYFDVVRLGGLSARMVLNLDVPDGRLEALYQSGTRISTLASGNRRVDLRTKDLDWLKERPISAITYIPAIDLEAEQIRGRFGEPAARVKEPENGADHWLYPELGLDVALSADDKEVFQYVAPSHFNEIVRPLVIE